MVEFAISQKSFSSSIACDWHNVHSLSLTGIGGLAVSDRFHEEFMIR